MIHKTIFGIRWSILGILLIFALGSCDKDDPVGEEGVGALTVTESEIVLGADADDKVITITSAQAWQITGTNDWCQVRPVHGESGETEVKVKSRFYYDYDDRSVTLTVTSGKETKEIVVVQKSKKAIILSPDNKEMPMEGGNFPVELKSSVKCEVFIAPEFSWITQVNTRSLETENLIFHVTTNNRGDRNGEIVIKDVESDYADTIKVYQKGDPSYQDRNVLTEFYNSVGGVQWKNRTNWLTDQPLSEWYGVSVNSAGRVSALVLPDNGLKGNLFASISGLTELERLVLSNNQLSGNFPAQLRLHPYWGIWDADVNIYPQQEGYGFTSQDGEVVTYQLATQGNGINIVILGDGYVESEVMAGAKFERDASEAVKLFFAIEPYKSYREYFNVYVVTAISNESGITVANRVKDTKFETKFVNLIGADMRTNSDICFTYAKKAPITNLSSTTIILLANNPGYGGTTMIWDDGSNIAICPVSELPEPQNFRSIIQHEAGGHAFAKLDEEYMIYNTFAPRSHLEEIARQERNGFYANIDDAYRPEEVKWAHFIGLEKYADVGVFEGGSNYVYGIFRPEANSCMRDASAYYNAPSREEMVKRIMKISGGTYSFEDFVEKDIIEKPYKKMRTLVERPYEPLGRTLLLEGSPGMK